MRDPEPQPGTVEQDKGAKGGVSKVLITEPQTTCSSILAAFKISSFYPYY